MKIRLFIIICFINSCDIQKSANKNDNGNTRAKIDSIELLHETILHFKESIKSSKDSLEQYRITRYSDSCLKVMYVINYMDTLSYTQNLKMNEIDIKLTEVKKISASAFYFHYSLFIKDSLPVYNTLLPGRGSVVHSFDFDTSTKRIIKAYLGQETSYISEKNIYKLYYNTLQNPDFVKYITLNQNRISPYFLRLIK